jgi:hypothetical protein
MFTVDATVTCSHATTNYRPFLSTFLEAFFTTQQVPNKSAYLFAKQSTICSAFHRTFFGSKHSSFCCSDYSAFYPAFLRAEHGPNFHPVKRPIDLPDESPNFDSFNASFFSSNFAAVRLPHWTAIILPYFSTEPCSNYESVRTSFELSV